MQDEGIFKEEILILRFYTVLSFLRHFGFYKKVLPFLADFLIFVDETNIFSNKPNHKTD